MSNNPVGIIDNEEFTVYRDEPSPPHAAAPSGPAAGAGVAHDPPGSAALGQLPSTSAAVGGLGAQQQPGRLPLGDRTEEYWGGYYRPLIEADEAAAFQSPLKAPSPSLRPPSYRQASTSPTKHTPSKGLGIPALHKPPPASSTGAHGAPLGLPPRSPMPPRHPQQQLFPTAGLLHPRSLPASAAFLSSPASLQAQENVGVWPGSTAPGPARPFQLQPAFGTTPPNLTDREQQQQPHQYQQAAPQQPAMGLAALLNQQKQQEQQQQLQHSSGIKRGPSPGPESASKVKRGLMFPP